MASLTVTESDDQSTPTPEEVGRVIEATRVAGVRLDEMHAGPMTFEGDSPVYGVRTRVPKYAFVENPSHVLVRIEHDVLIGADEEFDDATELSVAHVVTFALDADLETTPAALSAWIESNVYFLAYPYVRETLASLTTRMGLSPLTLDYLSRDERPFQDSVEDSPN